MGLSIKGYVLEPPRVGRNNADFTQTPNNFIENQGAFNAHFPDGSEPNPRVDYMVFVLGDGNIADATFCWTKNEVISRFDYFGRDQRYKLLPGKRTPRIGIITPDINTSGSRLKVPVPRDIPPGCAEAPFRLSVGTPLPGTTLTTVLVTTFGLPAPGTVEILTLTAGPDTAGELNWNAGDLVIYEGAGVHFQQQRFNKFTASTGKLGAASGVVLLNPIPGTGQFPMIRLGFERWKIPIEKPNQAAFSVDPASGTIEWARDTGLIKLHSTDMTGDLDVYYDGVVIGYDLQLPRTNLVGPGTVSGGGHITTNPKRGGDIIFRLPSFGDFQFSENQYVDAFDPNDAGNTGTVQLKEDSPAVGQLQARFSDADQIIYGGSSVEVVFGDLPIEHGISFRLFRNPINPEGSSAFKDVTGLYIINDAVFADPIIATPHIFLPSAPLQETPPDPDSFKVKIVQDTGFFPEGPFPNVGGVPPVTPGTTYGFVLDYDRRQLQYAFRKNEILVPFFAPTGTFSLPDPLITGTNYVFEIETGPLTGVYTPLIVNTDMILDATAGGVTFIKTEGSLLASGATGLIVGSSLTDVSADFTQVVPGDYLLITSGADWFDPIPGPRGLYTIVSVVGQTLNLDNAPPPGPLPGPVIYRVRRGKEVLADRYWSEVELIDPNTKVERINSLGMTVNDSLLTAGTATFPALTTLSDTGTDFELLGVLPGDTVKITSGPETGLFFRIQTVAATELNVTPSFISVAGATYEVHRRLNIPLVWIGKTRFRYGDTTFSTAVTTVADEAAFTAPGLLPAQTVQVSQRTGSLNFSQVDVTAALTTYWVRELKRNTDYKIQAGLSFIEFTDRLLALEEVLINYVTTDHPPVKVVEQATFAVGKERTADHPAPTSVVHFNPLNRKVAPTPTQKVFRGGRPQLIPDQVTVDITNSTITFLPDKEYQTDALPHGIPLAPTENIYIDYFILQAVGGEKSFTALKSMSVATINITDGSTSFSVLGNQTSLFPVDFLLRVESSETYRIGAVSYNGGTNQTTITLALGAKFQNDFLDPKLYVTSGLTRTVTVGFNPSYFATEIAPYSQVARGMNRIILTGNRTITYFTNTVILFTDFGGSFQEFYIVTGAKLTKEGNTEVTLASNTLRQYVPNTHILKHSVRPILDGSSIEVSTSRVPALTEPYQVFRQVEGDIGKLLTRKIDYTVDESGVVKVKDPLVASEEVSILYSGLILQPVGVRFKASYTAVTVPDDALNGLLDQTLMADYHLYHPDSFYFRVETMKNFRGEIMKAYKSSAASTSSGPTTSNAGTTPLREQGVKSLYFDEEHLANEDVVARRTLLWYHQTIDYLEDVLEQMDGRIVGHHTGRFQYDGVKGRTIGYVPPPFPAPPDPPTSLPPALNQIDDRYWVSPDPYTINYVPTGPDGPHFDIVSIGTYLQYYQLSGTSRFFNFLRSGFGVAAGGATTGDKLLDTKVKNVFLALNVSGRRAWAVTTKDAKIGDTQVFVDKATGSGTLTRPAFHKDMYVDIQARDGTMLSTTFATPPFAPPPGPVGPTSALKISAVAVGSITFTSALTVDVPAGSTIERSLSDTYLSSTQVPNTGGGAAKKPLGPDGFPGDMVPYAQLRDYYIDATSGQITFVKPGEGVSPYKWMPDPDNPSGNWIEDPDYAGDSTGGFFPVRAHPIEPGKPLDFTVFSLSGDPKALKFPALTGKAVDDNGSQNFPIITPSFDCEVASMGDPPPTEVGYLPSELTLESGIAGTTTPPFLGTGNLTSTTTIQLTAGNFPAPVPKVYDLVRILTGLNVGSPYRRITAVTLNTITVDTPFVVDAAFQFEVSVSSFVVPGISVGTFTTTTISDALANYTTVLPGYTVVIQAGPHTGERRQVTAVTSPSGPATLTFTPALPSGGLWSYRIDNSLATYGGVPGIPLADLNTLLGKELNILSIQVRPPAPSTVPWNERDGLERFLEQVFDNVVTGVNGSVTLGGSTFTDLSVDFLLAQVKVNNWVYIRSGPIRGTYKVITVAQHVLTLNAQSTAPSLVPFPVAAAGVSYRVCSAFGIGEKSIPNMFGVLAGVDDWIVATTTFKTLLTATWPVVKPGPTPDPNAYANPFTTEFGVLPGSRYLAVGARKAAVNTSGTGAISQIQAVLKGTERLYDKRYTWIDARINTKKGLLPSRERAIQTRQEAQADILENLIKLLIESAS